jgi:transposase-like protein
MRSTQSKKQTGSRRWRTAEEVEEILMAYWQSGHTQRVFAREAGISVSSLQSWLRLARPQGTKRPRKASQAVTARSVPLLEVELAEAAPGTPERAVRYEIEVPSGARLRLPGAFLEKEVRCLLRLLEEMH